MIRKHRLAERLLLDVVGMDRRLVHEEACRWEHVMSEQVEERLAAILDDVSVDPSATHPAAAAEHPSPSTDEVSVDRLAGRETVAAVVSRIGEPIQADAELITTLEDAAITAGAHVELRVSAGGVRLVGPSGDPVVLADDIARHLFVRR